MIAKEPPPVGDGRQGPPAAGPGTRSRAAVEERARLHDQRRAPGEGREAFRTSSLARAERTDEWQRSTGSEVLAKALRTQGVDTMFYLMAGRCSRRRPRASARHPRHRPPPRAGRLVRGARLHARDAAPRRLHGLLGSGRHQSSDRRGHRVHRLRAAGGHRRRQPRVYQGMEAFQEIDQLAVFKPVTKWAARIYDAKRIPDVVATAFREATTGRPGPVYIDMPGDILARRSRRTPSRTRGVESRRRARSGPRGGEGSDRAPGQGRATGDHRGQRRVVVGRRRRAAGLRRGHGHSRSTRSRSRAASSPRTTRCRS